MKRLVILAIAACLVLSPLTYCEGVPKPLNDGEWRDYLRGSWHDDYAIGSGYGKRFVFTSEECVFIHSEYQTTYWGDYRPTARAAYDVLDGELILDAEGVITRLSLEWIEIDARDLTAVIGGEIYYKLSDDPEYYLHPGDWEDDDLAEHGVTISGERIEYTAPASLKREGSVDEDYVDYDGFTDADWTRILCGSWMPSEQRGYEGVQRAFLSEQGVVLLPSFEGGEVFIGYWEYKKGKLGIYRHEDDHNYIMTIHIGGLSGDESLENEAWFELIIMYKYSDIVENDVPPEIASTIDNELFDLIFSESVVPDITKNR